MKSIFALASMFFIVQVIIFPQDEIVKQGQRQLEVDSKGSELQRVAEVEVFTREVTEGMEEKTEMDVVPTDHQTDTDTRPTMYTFFERIEEEDRQTGMSNEGDDDMLNLWHQEWNAAGFQTRVLTLEDARVHPRFLEFQQLVERIPLNTPTKIYNQMCYYRHLAMASVGGGYMSDYDILPLIKEQPSGFLSHRNLPATDLRSDIVKFRNSTISLHPIPISDDDKVIVYSMASFNGGIPCLMSGSAKHWETLAFAMAQNGVEHAQEILWSDMLAMIDLKEKYLYPGMESDPSESSNSLYEVQNLVLKRFPFSESDWKLQREFMNVCEKIDGKVAIHFSHHTLKDLGLSVNDRQKVAIQWLNDWKENCRNSTIHSENML